MVVVVVLVFGFDRCLFRSKTAFLWLKCKLNHSASKASPVSRACNGFHASGRKPATFSLAFHTLKPGMLA